MIRETDSASHSPLPARVRTGPVGRLARLSLAAVYAASLLSIVDRRGSAHFRNPHILTEPLAWLLHLVMLTPFLPSSPL